MTPTARAASPKKYVTQFDSTTSMLYALGSALHDKPFEGAGVVPGMSEVLPSLLNTLPGTVRRRLYRWGGWFGALKPRDVQAIRGEDISRWVTSQYPSGPFPAAFIGSSNGAVINLATALGVPWLPQTYLVSVRRNLDPDDIQGDIAWGREIARLLRARLPQFKLCQMHDPVQDRLMVASMGYFRIKRLRLGNRFASFLSKTLAPRAPVILVDCALTWAAVNVGEEHTFQIGGLGAMSPREYLHGSPRVRRFLRRHDKDLQGWTLPGNVIKQPESEWGFDSRLGDDAVRFAKQRGHPVRRLRFTNPEDISPLVADLYAWWYRRRGRRSGRLIAECFALLEPWLTVQTTSVPFWMAFNTEPSAGRLEAYLTRRAEFDEIFLMLMSNGVDGIGQVPISRWQRLLRSAGSRGEFLGVDSAKYPMDFASFVRYHSEFARKIPDRLPPPHPLTVKELDEFMSRRGDRYRVEWATLSRGRR